ncbi:MAG: hypothetical protein KGO49_03685 [Gammaproteobacteria bacterium]|nr:hypothetical protein [Gammaproteobacteria bacterium]
MMSTAKIFKKSKGSIVLLPSKFRLKGHQAYVHRDMQGNVILSANKFNPSESLNFSDKRSKPVGFSDLECEESLQASQDQLAWLRTLFMAIQADPDVEHGFLVHQLASIGNHLAETWMNQLSARRKESNAT